MNLVKAITAIIQRNWRIDKKYVETFTWRLFWPVINILIMGFLALFVSSALADYLDYNYIDFTIIGTMVWLLISAVFYETADTIRREIWEETLEGVYLSPSGRQAMILGNLVYAVLFVLVTVSILVGSAGVFFSFIIKGSLIDFAFSLMLIVYSIIGLGLIVSACTLLWKESHAISHAIMDVLVLVSGIYYPIKILPEAIQAISVVSPLTYSLEISRQIALNGKSLLELMPSLASLLVISTVLLAISIIVFLKIEKHVLKTKGLKQK